MSQNKDAVTDCSAAIRHLVQAGHEAAARILADTLPNPTAANDLIDELVAARCPDKAREEPLQLENEVIADASLSASGNDQANDFQEVEIARGQWGWIVVQNGKSRFEARQQLAKDYPETRHTANSLADVVAFANEHGAGIKNIE